ncbi:MAG: helix-turn-helix transcriptional regulator [Candidatus Omnitrophota bacterium]
MKKEVFLKFKKGKQKSIFIRAIKKAGSEKKLANLIRVSPASIYDYKNEIRPLPIKRAEKLARFLNLDFIEIKKEVEEKFIARWDNKEIKFLLKNYLNMTAKEIANKLNRSVDSIKHKRRQLALEKGPAYRWNKEKVITHFNVFKEKLGRIPTYQECSKEAGGMLSAIHRIWGKYSEFLKSLGLTAKIKKWTKKMCIEEFEKAKKEMGNIPTQRDLEMCSGLFRAIIRKWNSYNNFLKELGYQPNFELKWDKEKCMSEFEKLKVKKEHLPTIEEMRNSYPALVAAIYAYFESYPDFLRKTGYKYNDYWQKWERLITKICKKLYSNVIIKPKLKNNKQPDIAILRDGTFEKIIDVKLNSFASSIKRDIENYKPYCKQLEFWCLLGNKKINIKNVRVVQFNQIKQLLKKRKEKKLVNALKKME